MTALPLPSDSSTELFVTAMPTNPMEYIWPGIIVGQAIHTAAKLRIPDLLADGPKNDR